MASSAAITDLPPELLQHILRFLPTVELVRSRRVCRMWCALADVLTARDEYWRKKCTIDYSNVYETARTKCISDLTWQQLYQSLHLWTKLDTVPETNWIKLYNKKIGGDEVIDIAAFKGHPLVHMEDAVLFFNTEGKQIEVFNTVGFNMGYEETDNVIVQSLTLILNSGLIIIKKINGKPDYENIIFVFNALNFAIVADDVYYFKYDDGDEARLYYEKQAHVFVNRAEDNYETSVKLETFDEVIISIGHRHNTMSLLMDTMAIYKLEDNKFVCADFFDDNKPLVMLKKYNFDLCKEMMAELTKEVGFHVTSYYSYGDIMFLGDLKGVLKVYNSDKLISDALNCKPIVEYNLAAMLRLNNVERSLRFCGIDVIEKEFGHFIVVGVREGAFAIELSHVVKAHNDNDFIYTRTRSKRRKENEKVLSDFIYTRTRSKTQKRNENTKVMGSKVNKIRKINKKKK